jgi:hypothetical protein
MVELSMKKHFNVDVKEALELMRLVFTAANLNKIFTN